MMNGIFNFDRYSFDATTGMLSMHYSIEGGAQFQEKITFPKLTRTLSKDESVALDTALRLVFLLAGISYYKTTVAEKLACKAFDLDKVTAAFVEKTYRHGLGEFAWANKLDLKPCVNFVSNKAQPPQAQNIKLPRHSLVPVGGGKDSIVTLEILKRSGEPVTAYAQGRTSHSIATPIEETIKQADVPSIKVERELSPNLNDLNKAGAYNGHVPITAILSSITVVCAILYGFDAIIFSNEYSASSPNLIMDGIPVNHQYSKSLEFERDLADYIERHITPALNYFSLLRPLSEVAITKRFAKLTQYHNIFRSCNTAFKQDEAKRNKNWCCDCPKCRFVFLALAPFVLKPHMVEIFGKNMLDDANQTEGFAELCGLTAHKPFECVGEIEESALLMQKLFQSSEWNNDAVAAQLGSQLKNTNFDREYKALFALESDHRVPERYLRMFDEAV